MIDMGLDMNRWARSLLSSTFKYWRESWSYSYDNNLKLDYGFLGECISVCLCLHPHEKMRANEVRWRILEENIKDEKILHE